MLGFRAFTGFFFCLERAKNQQKINRLSKKQHSGQYSRSKDMCLMFYIAVTIVPLPIIDILCTFSFEISHEPRNAHLGRDTDKHMYIPSIISTPFHWHSCLNISLISKRFSSKNTFLRYFGANTIWYLQFHLVCAKLLLSMVTSFFIDKSPFMLFIL